MPLNSNFDSRIRVFVSRLFVLLFCMIPQLIFGQELDIESEMEQGIKYYQNAQFKQALHHFENIAGVLSEYGDDEELPVIYYLCQSCELFSGNIGRSIPYGEKAINYKNLSLEYQVQVLRLLLSAYDELTLKDKCISVIDKLNLIWESYKVTDIIEALVSYYCKHQEYVKIVELEGKLNHLNPEASNDIDKTSNIIQMNTIYMCMAKAFTESNEYGKSISYLEKCIDTLTPYTQENKSTIYLMMVDSYNKLGDKKAALKYQKLAIEAE